MPTRKFKIRYIKSNDYRVHLSTGVYGGLGTNGLINANFYVDRSVIPKSETIEVDDLQKKIIGKPLIEKDGDAVREVQFGTLLDVNTAKQLVDWLNKKISEHEERFKK
jgi:hypothetical protein